MTQFEIEQFASSLDLVEREENMGYIFYFVGDHHYLPFATIGYADNEGDAVSNLNREGVFRLNIGVSKEIFDSLFPDYDPIQSIDYTQFDRFLPHPHYASYSYICIVNPSKERSEQVKNYIQEAHAISMKRHEIRQRVHTP